MPKYEIKSVYSWAEVAAVHKVRNGIYQRRGELISLLTDFGRINACYPDFHAETKDTIHYTGAGRHGDQKLGAANRALRSAENSGIRVPLFNKLAPGRWEYLGEWIVVGGIYIYDEGQARMVWKFTLHKADSGD